jgi:hypothetical protein
MKLTEMSRVGVKLISRQYASRCQVHKFRRDYHKITFTFIRAQRERMFRLLPKRRKIIGENTFCRLPAGEE